MLIIKEKDIVYFASPMKWHNFKYAVTIDYSCEENSNIWHVNDKYGTIVMASFLSDRIIDVIRYSNIFDGDNIEDILINLNNNIYNLMKDTNYIVEDIIFTNKIVIARGNHCYQVNKYGVIDEVYDVCTKNDEKKYISSIYEVYKNSFKGNELIKKIYEELSNITQEQYFPIAVINTKDNSYKIIDK